jgi:uncharacterized protein (UPF0333 family)
MIKSLIKKSKSGQSTLEYAILTVIVIGALLAIQVYMKRGVQGRLKGASDDIGDQFSPGNTDYNKVITTHSKTQQTFKKGETKSLLMDKDTTDTTVDQSIINGAKENWGK